MSNILEGLWTLSNLIAIKQRREKIKQEHICELYETILKTTKERKLPKNLLSKEELLVLAEQVIDNILILEDFISIQPMKGPIDVIQTLEYVTLPNDSKPTLDAPEHKKEAGTRLLATSIDLENLLDDSAMLGKHMALEPISYAIGDEIIEEFIHYLKEVSQKTVTRKSDFTTCHELIRKTCNDIARNTRRTAGNRLLISHADYIRWLKEKKLFNTPYNGENVDSSELSSEDISKIEELSVPSVSYIGRFREDDNDPLRIYVSKYMEENEMLIGGNAGNDITFIDSCIVYAPYDIVFPYGIDTDPNTLKPIIKLMTRYGKHVVPNADMYYTTLSFKK